MLHVLITMLTIMAANAGTLDIVYEQELLDSAHHYYGENWEFEDGSWVSTALGTTYSGCPPFELCSWIGIDTPWEDILNAEDSAYMYKIVDMYKNQPAKFKLFGNQYH